MLAAVTSGDLPAARLECFHKLVREAKVVVAKTDARLRSQRKTISKAVKALYKQRGRD